MGHDVHAKFFDDKVVAENIQAAIEIGEIHGQLQEQDNILLGSALHDEAIPHQELQEETQVDREKGDHKDSQADCNSPDAGLLLDPVPGVVPTGNQNVNTPGGAETNDAHGKKEAKDLQREEDLGAPGAIRHVMEARVIFPFAMEAIDRSASNPHQHPDGTADPEDLPGGPDMADQDWVTDGQESVQADEADGEDAPVHADEVEALHQRTEGQEGVRLLGQNHLEWEGEHQQEVKDRQVDHVDAGGSVARPPLLQEGAKASDGEHIEDQTEEEGRDVDSQLHGFHQLFHIIKGAALALVLLAHIPSYNVNNRWDEALVTLYN